MKNNKGIVVQADKNQAVILLPGGEYRKVRTGGKYLEEGDLYEYNRTPLVRYAVAAVLVLAILAGGIDYNSVKAYASLGGDLELGINRWGRVVSVQAKSMGGQQILDNVQVKNDKLEAAVEKIASQAMQAEDINPQEIRQSIMIKVKDKQNQKLEKNIKKDVNKGLDKAIHQEKAKTNNGKDKNKKGQQLIIDDSQEKTKQVLKQETNYKVPQEKSSDLEKAKKQDILKEKKKEEQAEKKLEQSEKKEQQSEKKEQKSEKKEEQKEKQKSDQNGKNENSQSNSKNKNNKE